MYTSPRQTDSQTDRQTDRQRERELPVKVLPEGVDTAGGEGEDVAGTGAVIGRHGENGRHHVLQVARATVRRLVVTGRQSAVDSPQL